MLRRVGLDLRVVAARAACLPLPSFTRPAVQLAPCRALASSSSSGSSSKPAVPSVQEARKKIFGHWTGKEIGSTSFSALNKLKRRGWIGPKLMNYFPTPSPLWKHPLVRESLNEKRLAEVERRKALGIGPPPKGAGKQKKK